MRTRRRDARAALAAAVLALLPVLALPVPASWDAAARAATPSCGPSCLTPFTQEFGPSFVLDVLRARARAGQPIILFPLSTHDGAEDFSYSLQGTVGELYTDGLVSRSLALHYASLSAFELEYTPYGRGTGLCAGVARAARAGTLVSLQACGVSPRTIWIPDYVDVPAAPGSIPRGPVPVINGSGANFSHPYVAAYPGNGASPRDRPRPRVRTKNLTRFRGGTVFDNQMWGIPEFGSPPGSVTFQPNATPPVAVIGQAPFTETMGGAR